MPSLTERLRNSWNAFMNRDPTNRLYFDSHYGLSSGYRPDRPRLSRGNERSIVTTIYNRIAVDCSAINIKHVRLDENNRYVEDIDSHLGEALRLDPNLDQTARTFIIDVVQSMFDEGTIAIVPTVTTEDPRKSDAYDIYEMRTARILGWYPEHIKVEIYNHMTGQKVQMVVEKRTTAIIENPFYSLMNEYDSMLQRLIRILNQLDKFNTDISAGKIDLILQLPYVIKSDARKEQANIRRKMIEDQLVNSKYGIAYTDGTERITQLNRPVENNLWNQAKDLLQQIYNQLGLTQAIFDGTADEQTMLNYYNRVIDPIMTEIVEEMERKWLSKTARTQKQSIRYFRDPFKLVPVNNLAEISDKFTRNEIMTSNEIRSIVGMRPSEDPKADQLLNSNLNHYKDGADNQNEEMIPEDQLEEVPEEAAAGEIPEGIDTQAIMEEVLKELEKGGT